MHFLAKTICHATQSQQVKRCVYIDTGVCNMYKLYTHFTKFADRNNSAEGCVYMACVCIFRNVIRSYILERGARTHTHTHALVSIDANASSCDSSFLVTRFVGCLARSPAVDGALDDPVDL